MMFPSTKIPLTALKEILRGGIDKVTECGAVIIGGHTIDDYPPKYGLAVTGVVHPRRIITNAKAQPGNLLILAKPLGSGVIIAGKRIGEVGHAAYQAALDSMKLLNKNGAEIMQRFNVQCATDVTGFSLLGHALRLAQASKVTLRIDTSALPLLDEAYGLVDMGCIPGAAFRNQEFVEPYCRFSPDIDYNRKMLALDAQTSGGLLICAPPSNATAMLSELRTGGYPAATVIGMVMEQAAEPLIAN
jgi:selenide,water dikinase